MLFKYSDFVRLLLFALILCSAQAARDEVLAQARRCLQGSGGQSSRWSAK
eukprot:COSAG02_NODE_62570_length_265_cov_0.969880_1_plen_49_part_10